MPLDFTFTCPLPNGIHARPASALEEVTRRFASRVTLVNERTAETADARSVLAMVGLAIGDGDRCRLVAEGPDEEAAITGLRGCVEQRLAHCDDVVPGGAVASPERTLPRLLVDSGATFLRGVATGSGIGQGRAVRLRRQGFAPSAPLLEERPADVAAEKGRLDAALRQLLDDYESRIERLGPGVAADVLGAHRAVARDPEFRRRIDAALATGVRTAADAILEAQHHFERVLAGSASLRLRERAIDVRDVATALLRLLHGSDAIGREAVELTGDAVVVADDLTPSEFLTLDRQHLKGLVLANGSTTSHTVILARSFGVPTIVGVEALDERVFDGRDVVADGDLGVLVTGVTEACARYYAMERARLGAREIRLRRLAGEPAVTVDGRRLEIAANIAAPEEAALAFAAGAEAIGVFRTEMLFADRDEAPAEEEQCDAYRRAAVAGDGRRVVVRTLDVGGDKPLPYLHLPREPNPFLGYRAVRMYAAHELLFRAQVRAIVRASASGRMALMIPFVSSVEEVRWVRRIVAEEQAAVNLAAPVEIGAMIEVPSAAFALDHLAPLLEFFSVGSNDLLQYFVAADRGNRHVASLYDPLAPAFLRFLRTIVEGVHAHGRSIGLCGEMAADPRCLPLLVGLGFDELSVATPHLARVKADVRILSASTCRSLADRALACETAAEVGALVEATGTGPDVPLLVPDLVIVDAACRTKQEAVKQVADLLSVLGRTERPLEVEEALWQREATYSTGVGHGFAIPHCRSRAVGADSLVVLKLATPVDWDSLDGVPVDVVIALALGEGAGAVHLRVLATLARRLMHEDFRAAIAREQDPTSLSAFIGAAIGIAGVSAPAGLPIRRSADFPIPRSPDETRT